MSNRITPIQRVFFGVIDISLGRNIAMNVRYKPEAAKALLEHRDKYRRLLYVFKAYFPDEDWAGCAPKEIDLDDDAFLAAAQERHDRAEEYWKSIPGEERIEIYTDSEGKSHQYRVKVR